jgi:hypothetical protein
MRAVALGLVGLGQDRRGQSHHRGLGPGEVQDDEEPYEGEQDELIGKLMRHHGVAPSNMGGDGGILPGFGVV